MRRSASPVGPIVMIVPLLSLVAGALWMRTRLPSGPPPSAPAVSDPDASVRGWSGTWEAGDGAGGTVLLELFPLHADPERQAFDARALARRLGIEPGEPWRLRVRQDDRARRLDLASLAVFDGREPRLAPVGDGVRGGPLGSLFAPPDPGIGAGDLVVEVLLWGTAPDDGARVRGRDLDGNAVEIVLAPHERPRRELPAFLARLDPAVDPADRGKETDPDASVEATAPERGSR